MVHRSSLFVLLFLLVINLASSIREERKSGVLFNFQQKILLSEKFENVRFTIPFPALRFQIEEHLGAIANSLTQLWSYPNDGCKLDYSVINTSNVTTRWVYQQVVHELQKAKEDLATTKLEIQEVFQSINSGTDYLSRGKRFAGLALAGTGAAAVFGIGMGVGNKLDCVLKGIFGSCEQIARENRKAIGKTIANLNVLATEWEKVQNTTNERFYLVASQLKEIERTQDEMRRIQNDNFAQISEEFSRVTANIHILRNCNQFLYSRQQVNHHLANLNGILLAMYTNLKTFRLAVHSFQVNIMSSMSIMAERFVPLSLVPRRLLAEILNELVLENSRKGIRLTLAIPSQSILTYYETKLLKQVTADDLGMHFVVTIPFASHETVLNVYRAIVIPMPSGQKGKASVWTTESEFLAVSESKSEAALISSEELRDCIGSNSYSICTKSFAMEKTKDSCLATLLFKDDVAALQNCRLSEIDLPIKEKAINLGFGRWLILSASDNYLLTESVMNSSHPFQVEHHKGCQVCIFTLECGHELQGPNVHIRSDLESCSEVPPMRIDIALPSPLSNLFSKLPPIDDMPHISSLSDAKVQLISELQTSLATIPEHERRDEKVIAAIANPIVSRFKQINPSFSKKFDETLNWKSYLIIACCSLLVTVIIHGVMFVASHRLTAINKRFPFALKVKGKSIRTKPVAVVTMEDRL